VVTLVGNDTRIGERQAVTWKRRTT